MSRDRFDVLERFAPLFEAPEPSFEDFLRRRDRKRRNQRIGAAVLGIAVALVSFAALTRTFGTVDRPADQPTPTPTPAPRNVGSLAYAKDGDIYVADWDGSNAVRIANGRPADECHGNAEYWGEGPIWSPDGKYLAFRHTDCDAGPRDVWWDVVISDPQGNVVTSFPSEGWLISWSPDSTRVATWVRWGETIGVHGLDGVRQAVLTVPPGMMAPGDYDPVWSPDGESLVVPYGVVIPLDGSAPRLLPTADRSPGATFSPDGSRVAHIAKGSVVVAPANGSPPQAGFAPWHPVVWSLTGEQIAFTLQKATELRVLDVATGAETLLAEAGDSDWLDVIEFSPEGDRILFSRMDDRGRGESSLWSINADGSGRRHLVSGTTWGDWQSLSQTR
jgi:Tol biopolymer transport system component